MTRIFKIAFMSSLLVIGVWNTGFAYEIADVVKPGILKGKITFTGKVPAPRNFKVEKNPEICGETRPLKKVSVENGKLQGVVLALEGITRGKAFEEKSFQAALPGEGKFQYHAGENLDLEVQAKHCNFGPFTGVVARNEPIHFSNHDSIKHTLHTYVRRGTKATILKTVHNQGIPAEGSITKTFTKKKLPSHGVVAVTCDRHDFMENWLYVVENPYFAISDKQGNFHIDGIPPGQYSLVAWHPFLGTQKQTLIISANQTVDIQFGFHK